MWTRSKSAMSTPSSMVGEQTRVRQPPANLNFLPRVTVFPAETAFASFLSPGLTTWAVCSRASIAANATDDSR